MVGRTYYKESGPLANSATFDDHGPDILPAEPYEATLVGSSTGKVTRNGSMHMPAIDIDFPCQLVESSTPGHYHLYIDVEISLEQYLGILAAMTKAGIVQQGFYRSAVRRGQTFLRRPGVKKEPAYTPIQLKYLSPKRQRKLRKKAKGNARFPW